MANYSDRGLTSPSTHTSDTRLRHTCQQDGPAREVGGGGVPVLAHSQSHTETLESELKRNSEVTSFCSCNVLQQLDSSLEV